MAPSTSQSAIFHSTPRRCRNISGTSNIHTLRAALHPFFHCTLNDFEAFQANSLNHKFSGVGSRWMESERLHIWVSQVANPESGCDALDCSIIASGSPIVVYPPARHRHQHDQSGVAFRQRVKILTDGDQVTGGSEDHQSILVDNRQRTHEIELTEARVHGNFIKGLNLAETRRIRQPLPLEHPLKLEIKFRIRNIIPRHCAPMPGRGSREFAPIARVNYQI